MTTTASEMGPPPTDLPGDDKPAAGDPSSSNDGATAPAAPDTAPVEEMPPPPPRDSGQKRPIVPYTVPEWSGPPCHSYTLEVLKDGSIVDQLSVSEKGAYMFGRVDLCDFVLEHPTISRFHAVLQFKRSGDAYIYDTGSTHGTFVNKKQVEKRVHVELHVGDVIRFGQSSRLYILQGPPDLMPPETDLKILKEAKIRQAVFDREASLRRAKAEASIADGISWGMVEDAIEDVEDDDGDEITWQTYRGQLTEKQEKTREKILKRTEKIAHMKKEIDAIRAKDIAQGGLTQGQQTQIARNELRITQLMEELENLEETLNESIRESLGARGEKRHGKTKGATEDDEYLSDEDDEFYDRTKKPSRQKAGENQAVETADTLLDKKDAITKEIENKKESLLIEKGKNESDTEARTESKDSLDDFMSGVSSQLVLDKTTKLEEELSALQSELDRIFFLLRIADPSGEAANKREKKMQVKRDCVNAQVATSKRQPQLEPQKISESKKSVNVSEGEKEQRTSDAELSGKQEPKKIVTDTTDNQKTVYTVVKPQWLGAVDDMKIEEIKPEEPSHKPEEPSNLDKYDQFVDYKDRQKVLSGGVQGTVGSEIESAAPGLIVRKRKEKEEPPTINHEAAEHLGQSSGGAEFVAEDVVALLLKHKRGYHGDEDGLESQNQEGAGEKQSRSNNKKPKRVLGPEKPSFLKSPSDDESWLPPEGQSGDGRTSLNERYGY